VLAAKDRGVSVVFITHNPHHAYLVGDFFYLLNRGKLANEFEREKVELDELTKAMAGGAELDALTREIQTVREGQ
jgi:simple sugar transport system ATP-binding protein